MMITPSRNPTAAPAAIPAPTAIAEAITLDERDERPPEQGAEA